MKRKSPYELNQANLSDDENPGPELGKISTPEEIAQRRIVRVKGRSSGAESAAAEESAASAKLVLAQKLDDAPAAATNTSVEKKDAQVSEEPKKLEFSSSSSLFGAKPATTVTPAAAAAPSSGLFANIGTSAVASSSLFGNISSGSNLFSNLSAASSSSSSLFGNKGTGLFANLSNNGEQKPAITNIFNVEKPAGGLFANLAPNPAGSLFGNLSKPDAAAGGLFANINNQSAANNGSDDEDGGEDEDEQEASPEIDAANQVMFQYNNPYDKILEKAIVKLRRGTGDVLEKGTITLERLKEDEKSNPIFSYRNQIKTLIFSFTVQKGITKAEKINDSAKNLKITYYSKNASDGKIVPTIVKIQFSEEKEGQEVLDKLMETLKQE